MKQISLVLLSLLALMVSCKSESDKVQLNTRQDTLSWAMGEDIALALKQVAGVELNYDLVQKAVSYTLANKKQLLSDSEYVKAMDTIILAQQIEAMRQTSNREEEATRLQQQYFEQLTKEHPNVKKHPSGFYYEIVKEGRGRHPKYGERVSFDYRSFVMLTGEAWDQTYGKREPILHTVGKPMFPGLIDGMQLMNEGAIYRFYFPYQLAFGPNGSGDIPGFTPFIYEVELHKVFND